MRGSSLVRLTLMISLLPGIAIAADPGYPNKALRFVTCEVGGGSDLVTRMVAQGITGGLGQTVIVETRPCGVIPGDIVSVASPDGYTVLLSGSPLWLSPLLKDGVRYDPIKDFSHITLVSTSPTLLVVRGALALETGGLSVCGCARRDRRGRRRHIGSSPAPDAGHRSL